MDLKRAREILGINESSSMDEIKKAYKKLAAKNHPDIIKDNGEKFKEINSAYEFINNCQNKEVKETLNFQNINVNFQNISDLFNNQHIKDFINFITPDPPIEVPLTISFEESVLGCEKFIEYYRNKACSQCSGAGFTSDKICQECNGKGKKTSQRKGMFNFGSSIVIQDCDKCNGVGRLDLKECTKCLGSCEENFHQKLKIRIPAGIQSGKNLRLSEVGNFNPQSKEYNDVIVKISVLPHPKLKLDNYGNVTMSESISLLDALKGKEITVPTVNGDKIIIIPPKTLNNSTISINGCGVGGNGKQLVIINVSYPEDVTELIKVLEKD